MKIYSSDDCDARQCLDLGMAIGAWLGQNGMIMTGTDGKPISRLVRRGVQPPVFMSANIDGADEYNARLLEENRQRIHYMQ